MNETLFDGLGNVYSKYRPAYPEKLIDYLYTNAGLCEKSDVADIGSGTGIFTEQLLRRGSNVFAVEPSVDMRKKAEERLRSFRGFTSVNGTGENTGLPDGCADFVTAAQSFHWLDRVGFKNECRRILRCGGKVILIWNFRDESSEIVKENEKICKKYCPEFIGFSGGLGKRLNGNGFCGFFEGEYDRITIENPIDFDETGFIGRNISSSFAPRPKDAKYSGYVSELTELFRRYSRNGVLEMPNLTCAYIGSVR